MSLYYLQKFIYDLNRDPRKREQFESDLEGLLSEYVLDDEELEALKAPDIGKLYVLGVNGQLLMHYAAIHKYEWPEYMEAMREGVRQYGPVRAGLYAMVGDLNE